MLRALTEGTKSYVVDPSGPGQKAVLDRIVSVFRSGEGTVSRADFISLLNGTSLAEHGERLGDLFFDAVSKRSLDAAFDLVEAVFPGIHIQGAFCANREMSSQSASISWTDGSTAASGFSKKLCPAHQIVEAFLQLLENIWIKSPDTLRGKIEPMTGRPVFAGVVRNRV